MHEEFGIELSRSHPILGILFVETVHLSVSANFGTNEEKTYS